MTTHASLLESLDSCTLERYVQEFKERRLLHGVLDHWASEKPDLVAIHNATRGSAMTWRELRELSIAMATRLWALGFKKGDFLAASLPLLDGHIALEYACFRLGVIHVPLDLRLSEEERDRCLAMVDAKGYITALKQAPPKLPHLWEAGDIAEFMQPSRPTSLPEWPEVRPEDGAQVVFTTGSTGKPKAALLTHGSITAQNFALGQAFDFEGKRVLVNLPASHVGGQAELLLTTLFWGATAITLEVFDPGKSLEAIEAHRVTLLGQIPAMFQMEWRHPDFATRDLQSLDTVVYGGQSVPRPFLERLRAMGPRIATGLGLTEASGFCTYTSLDSDVDDLAKGLGRSLPIYPMSIRKPMKADGSAGEEVPDGETGCVCFNGPQTFAGYVNDPEATSRAISTDGYLYTGDMGSRHNQELRFAGRESWVIKVAGYQVFPGEVEAHFCAMTGKVASCAAVGVKHPLWSEVIVLFVEKAPGAELSIAELRCHARHLTSYKRPRRYVILESGQMPMNRVAKIDVLRLKAMTEDCDAMLA